MRPGRAQLALLVTVLAWASAFPAIRVAVAGLGPAGLTLGRLLAASVTLALAAPLLGVRLPRRADLPLVGLCGLLGMTLYQLLLGGGELRVEAGPASLLIATSPVYSCLFAARLLGERLTAGRMSGIGIALGGATIVAFGQGGGLRFGAAALLVLGAAVVHGAYPVAIKPLLARYTGLEVASYTMWAGTLLALPLVPFAVGGGLHWSAGAVLATAYLGAVPSAAGFVAWGYAVARLEIAVATSALYLISPTAFAVAYLWLGETPGPLELAGGAVAIAGVAVTQYFARSPAPARRRLAQGRAEDVESPR